MIRSQICKFQIKQFEHPFRKLQLSDRKWVENACHQDGGISCHINFVMMYLTQEEYQFDLFRECCGCVLKRPWAENGTLFYQYPIGSPENRKKAVEKIINLYSGLYNQIVFFGATEQHLEEVKALYGHKISNIRMDPTAQDYILDIQEQINLEGSKFSNKRQKIRRFYKRYNCTYEPITSANIEECLAVNHQWYTSQDRDSTAAREQASLQLALKEFEQLKLQGELCRIDGKPVAIYIGTPLNKDVYQSLYMKADTSYPDISLAFAQEFLKRNCSGFTYSNEGMDAGLPGLREFKKNMHPVFMTSFYYITLVS